MKRFGLPILLSAGYASLLWLVFSSDFSKEHSFLLKEEPGTPTAKLAQQSHGSGILRISDRIATLEAVHLAHPASPEAVTIAEVQSPESSESGQ